MQDDPLESLISTLGRPFPWVTQEQMKLSMCWQAQQSHMLV